MALPNHWTRLIVLAIATLTAAYTSRSPQSQHSPTPAISLRTPSLTTSDATATQAATAATSRIGSAYMHVLAALTSRIRTFRATSCRGGE